MDVMAVDDQAGVAQLEEALRAAWPADDRISRDRGAAERVAGICGGLPLALRITAALLIADPALTVAELGDELADEVQRLEGLQYDDGSGTSAPSVAAAFGLSCRRLDLAAARLFHLLPVNPGPDVSTAAAAALAGRPVSETREVLGQLARAHLVEAAAGAAGRWRMHDLLHLYARQLSDAYAHADGREQARDRLLDYYLTTAGAAADHMRALPGTPVPAAFSGRDAALAWLDGEQASLIPAVTLAANTGRDRIAMLLPLQLGEYLSWWRRFDDWLAVASISRDAARRLGDRTNEAVTLINLGAALVEMDRFQEAISAHQDAAAIYWETGDRYREGVALDNLGLALVRAGRFEEAISAHQEGLAIYRETGDRHGEGASLNNLGLALREVGRFEEAISVHQGAAAILRETGDRHGEGVALRNLQGDRAGRDVMAAGRLRETGEPGIRNVSADSIDPPGDTRGWQADNWATERARSGPLEDRPQRRRWRRPVVAWAIGGFLAVSVVAGLVYKEAAGNSANVPAHSQGAAPASSPSASAKASRSASSSPAPSASASSSPAPSASASSSRAPSARASSSRAPSARASSSPAPSAHASSSPAPSAHASSSSSPAPSASASSSPAPSASASSSASQSPTTPAAVAVRVAILMRLTVSSSVYAVAPIRIQ
jgi:tetratricopeptide (TPR) repeat protein